VVSAQRYIQWICLAALACDAALIAVNLAMNAGLAMPLEVLDAQLDMKDEGNLAAWYSSAQLLLVALLAGALACGTAPECGRVWLHRATWVGVAAIAMALSADETAQLHEWLGQRYDDRVGPNDVLSRVIGVSSVYKWLIVLAAPAFVAAALLLYAAARMWRVNRRSALLAVAGVACWIVTLAAEFVESQYFERSRTHYPGWRGQQASIEEGAELLGAALLLLAIAGCLLKAFAAQDAMTARGQAPRKP
jgi:hypothetical protein